MMKGDFQKLGALASNIGKLAAIPARVSSEAAPELAKLIDKQFDTGTDPYGRPWAKLKASTVKSGRRPPPLTNERHLRKGVRVKPMHAGVSITFQSPVPAAFHQHGTKHMDARKILPERGMPRAWSDMLTKLSANAIRRTVEGR